MSKCNAPGSQAGSTLFDLRLLPDESIGRLDFIGLVRSAIDSLPEDVRSKVGDICDQFEIPIANRASVLWWVHRIRHFEKNKSGLAPTSNERAAAIKRIADAAKELTEALDALKPADRSDFDVTMAAAMGTLLPKLDIEAHLTVVAFTATFLERNLLDQSTGHVKGGRRPVLKHYASFVEGLSFAAQAAGIHLGRSGQFEKFCEGVFKAAGVPASAEGAVRAFVEDRKKQA